MKDAQRIEARELYEARQKLLAGLWQPGGPPWHELSQNARERWARYAQDAVKQ